MKALALTVFLLLPACMDVAEARARHDLTIGHVSGAGLRVDVGEGLAHVRQLEPGSLRLWAQAPVLDIDLVADTAGEWEISIRNILSSAELTGTASVSLTASPLPTQKVWRVALPAGSTRLRLAPADTDDLAPWRFAIFADVQEAVDEVQDIFARMNLDPEIRFALISGDLSASGTDAQLERFQREISTLRFPCFATLGNHELQTEDLAFHRYFGRGSFSFVFRGARFTLVDDGSATLAPQVHDWIEGWAEEGRDQAHTVIMHLPLLDPVGLRNGAFASRAEAARVLSTLARGDVDLTVYGHVHSYYAFDNAGIPAYISGGGGSIPEELDGIGRHYLAVDVDPTTQLFEVGMVRVD